MPKRFRTHPADVTADRLMQQYEVYFDQLEPSERNAFSDVINALREIAEGNRR
jgi:hypothetical protein